MTHLGTTLYRLCIISFLTAYPLMARDKYKVDFSPVFSSTPSTGFSMGGAFFIHPTEAFPHKMDIKASLTTKAKYKLETLYIKPHFLLEDLSLDILAHIENVGYNERYDNAQREGQNQLKGKTYNFNVGTTYAFDNGIFSGIFSNVKAFQEDITDEHSKSISYGLSVGLDQRDDPSNSKEGYYINITNTLLPQADNAIKSEADFRNFISFDQLTWAFRLSGGVANKPLESQIDQYALGGGHTLRGTPRHRLIGDEFYLMQNELRLSVGSLSIFPVDLVAFSEYGDAKSRNAKNRDTKNEGMTSHPILTTGVGARFALPPSMKVKLRFDLAYSEEKLGFYVLFREAF